ncbi:hypothetical protein F7Q99_01180 [Streptomyces kaniharaensis]|uniref:Recombinase family protein n=1 Tax=Streptomyces kaniharaensis TaxID=212423 RepID=A0A6N7KKQ8_9ACTN|nr:hypothetical protein [Streptomyces kaniharaensis]MQS10927.1 hypothetical protein [Streptomyces kaniharaensis]
MPLNSRSSKPELSSSIQSFQAVIYLPRIGPTFPELEMRSCEDYALAFGWGISLTVVDDDMETPPDRRAKLQVALRRIKDKQASAILVPSKATISPIDGEYHEFARQVEKAGGFVQVTRQ